MVREIFQHLINAADSSYNCDAMYPDLLVHHRKMIELSVSRDVD
jgi:hypothetical protein